MKLLNRIVLACAFILGSFSTSIQAQNFDSNTFYRLNTQWQGEGKSLDVINDGKNNKLHLAKTNKVSGQAWKITSVGNGYYRLTTQWQGDGKSLDVINDGKNNQLHLAKTGKYTGQYWKITSVGNGYYRLTTQWQGDGKSLDVINDGKNNQLHLAKTGKYTGQYWKITPYNKASANIKSELKAGETLKAGQQLTSANGAYILRMQAEDGNLCLYKFANGKQGSFVWGSMKYGFKNAQLKMQTDGNLVVYDRSNEAKWSSQTHPYFDAKFRSSNNKPVKLVLTNSGKLNLVTASGSVVWTSK